MYGALSETRTHSWRFASLEAKNKQKKKKKEKEEKNCNLGYYRDSH